MKRAAESIDHSPRPVHRVNPSTRAELLAQRVIDKNMGEDIFVDTFLEVVLSGDAGQLKAIEADAWRAFETMLVCQNFELFVEAFTLYGDMRTEADSKVGESFRPTLILCLPEDWRATDTTAMEAAFKAIRPDKVVVILADEGDVISGDVGRCVEILVKNGATHLSVKGPFVDASRVAGALGGTRLSRLSLLVEDGRDDELSRDEKLSIDALCTGASRCGTLQRLDLTNSLDGACTGLETWQSNSGASLTQLTLRLLDEEQPAPGKGADVDQSLATLLNIVNRFSDLTHLEVLLENDDMAQPVSDHLDPLRGHQKLRHLKIFSSCGKETVVDLSHRDCLGNMVAFSASCPALMSLQWGRSELPWAFPNQLIAAMQRAVQNGPLEADMTAMLRAPTFTLQTLSLGGEVLAYASLAALFHALKFNSTLEKLDLRGCKLPMEAMPALVDLLQSNLALEVVLPEDGNFFYLLTKEGRVHFFQANAHGGYELKVNTAGAGQDARDGIEMDALKSVQPMAALARTLVVTVSQLLANNRMRMGLNQLTPSLQSVLTQAASALLPNALVGSDVFGYVAERALEHLQGEHAIPQVVRLSEVNVAANAAMPRVVVDGVSGPHPRLRELVAQNHIDHAQALRRMAPPPSDVPTGNGTPGMEG